MQQLKFLYGENLVGKNPIIKPGTIYLDIATGEMFFDDPSSAKQSHAKIIDTETLIYTMKLLGDSLTYPSPGSEDEDIPGINEGPNSGAASAVLGVAVLGSMILGSS